MKIEIWFEFASTYSYLTVTRAEEEIRIAGLEFEWRPFLLGPIFKEKGWTTSPFLLDEVKGAYMWRDMSRRAMRYGIPFEKPRIFPAHSLNATRLFMAVSTEPWCGAFAKDVFDAQFARGEDISDWQVLLGVMSRHTVDPERWVVLAQSDRVKEALRAQTETASAIGIFGAPSFRVGNEIFWGDDRLEDAIEWACKCGMA